MNYLQFLYFKTQLLSRKWILMRKVPFHSVLKRLSDRGRD